MNRELTSLFRNVENCTSFVNPFILSASFRYPLKISTFFWCFQGVEKGRIGNKWVNIFQKLFKGWKILIECAVMSWCNTGFTFSELISFAAVFIKLCQLTTCRTKDTCTRVLLSKFKKGNLKTWSQSILELIILPNYERNYRIREPMKW